jgi:hypothetical protein
MGGEQMKNDPARNVAHNSFPSKDWPNCILPLRATPKKMLTPLLISVLGLKREKNMLQQFP